MKLYKEKRQAAGFLPAGKYYIGDPCHVIDTGDSWNGYLNLMLEMETRTWVHWGAHGDMFCANTAHGDGTYRCDVMTDGCVLSVDCFGIAVDAGLIGLTGFQNDFINEDEAHRMEAKGGGRIVEFADPVGYLYDGSRYTFASGSYLLMIETDETEVTYLKDLYDSSCEYEDKYGYNDNGYPIGA